MFSVKQLSLFIGIFEVSSRVFARETPVDWAMHMKEDDRKIEDARNCDFT
jgi:hypothetical protein